MELSIEEKKKIIGLAKSLDLSSHDLAYTSCIINNWFDGIYYVWYFSTHIMENNSGLYSGSEYEANKEHGLSPNRLTFILNVIIAQTTENQTEIISELLIKWKHCKPIFPKSISCDNFIAFGFQEIEDSSVYDLVYIKNQEEFCRILSEMLKNISGEWQQKYILTDCILEMGLDSTELLLQDIINHAKNFNPDSSWLGWAALQVAPLRFPSIEYYKFCHDNYEKFTANKSKCDDITGKLKQLFWLAELSIEQIAQVLSQDYPLICGLSIDVDNNPMVFTSLISAQNGNIQIDRSPTIEKLIELIKTKNNPLIQYLKSLDLISLDAIDITNFIISITSEYNILLEHQIKSNIKINILNPKALVAYYNFLNHE